VNDRHRDIFFPMLPLLIAVAAGVSAFVVVRLPLSASGQQFAFATACALALAVYANRDGVAHDVAILGASRASADADGAADASIQPIDELNDPRSDASIKLIAAAALSIFSGGLVYMCLLGPGIHGPGRRVQASDYVPGAMAMLRGSSS
jgi:hypothetical protein